MAASIVKSQDCCAPCKSPEVVNVPGPEGDDGGDGLNGTDGINAYTTLTANFTVPAVSATAVATVVESGWAVIGQTVFLQQGGDFLVTNKTDSTHVTLQNLGYPNNSAPATVVPPGMAIGPSGQRGQQGTSGLTATLDNLVTAAGAGGTRGNLLVDNGASSPNAHTVAIATGGAPSNGKVLAADAAQATGLSWNTVLPNSATDNAIIRFNGTTGKPVPGQNSSMAITDDGALQSSPTGGNARGSKSVDLQVERSVATQVASGAKAVIAGGNDNTASGNSSAVLGGNSNIAIGGNSVIAGGSGNNATGLKAVISGGDSNTSSGTVSTVTGGAGNTASGDYAHAGGLTNEASGNYSTAVGGRENIVSADYAVAHGRANEASATYASASGFSSRADVHGKHSQSSGVFSATGDAQTSVLTFFGTTSNATITEIFLDGSSLQAVLSNNTTWAFRALIAARRTDTTGNSAAYQILGCIKRDSTAGSTALVGTITTTVIAEDDASWDVDMQADTSNGALSLFVTGALGKDIQWVARVELTETTNA